MFKWILLSFSVLSLLPEQQIYSTAFSPLDLSANVVQLAEFICHLMNVASCYRTEKN